MYFDTHAHLDDERFNEEREALIESFKENGISLVMNVGADMKDSIDGVSMAREHDEIYAAVGIHPEFAETVNEKTLETLLVLAISSKKVKAIGEIGLDYHYDNFDKETQKKAFRAQMELAKKLNLPVIIHSRDAYADTLEIIKEYPDLKKVIHCFSGNNENAKELFGLGCYISFTGVITFKNAKKFEEILKEAPLDRIFFETDCPYMAPEPVRGTVNNPINVKHIVKKAAETIGIEAEKLAEISTETARKFFEI